MIVLNAILAGCEPLLVPDQGPNNPDFPQLVQLTNFEAHFADAAETPISDYAMGGSIDAIDGYRGGVRVSGWAPVVNHGALWVFGLEPDGDTVLSVEAVPRGDVASLVAPEYVGSGFLIDAAGYVIAEPGKGICVAAETGDRWFILAGSTIELCLDPLS